MDAAEAHGAAVADILVNAVNAEDGFKLTVRDECGVQPVSYTHLDVYKRQLEQCADRILYLRAGQLAADATLEAFAAAYRLVEIPEGTSVPEGLIGCKPAKHGQTALIPTEQVGRLNLPTKPADLSAIMVHLEKEALQ